jgi:hypothetical protein
MAPSLENLRIQAREPACDFPATTLRAYLKQVNVPLLDQRLRQAVDDCFPLFASDPAANWTAFFEEHGRHGEPVQPLSITAAGMYDNTQGRHRRYAGGRDLSGGRYYSVCRDDTGNDGGTLCYELMSYWNSTTGWYLFLTDSSVHQEEIERSPLTSFFRERHPVLLVIATSIDGIRVTEKGPVATGKTHPIPLPLRLLEVTCDNVLDLRLPAAQDWLVARCRGAYKPFGFGDLFANLISPSPGGNLFHQNLGAWLRAHGCLGLVYPSARRDVFVDASDDRVIDSDGWNFVNYEGCPLRAEDRKLGPPFPWLTPDKIGIDLFHQTEGGIRSWTVQGAEKGEWARINYEIRRSRGQAPQQSVTFSPFDDGRPIRGAPGTVFGPLRPDP